MIGGDGENDGDDVRMMVRMGEMVVMVRMGGIVVMVRMGGIVRLVVAI